MSKIYRQFRYHVAGSKLTEQQLSEMSTEAWVEKLDFKKMPAEQVLEKIDSKLEKYGRRLILFYSVSLGALALLFSSLMGVELKISLLGLQLQNIQLIKEPILVLATCTGPIAMRLTERVEHLQAMRKHVFIKEYGADLHKFISPTFSHAAEWDRFSSSPDGLVSSWARIFYLVSALLSATMSVTIFMLSLVGMWLFLLWDIWIDPNWSEVPARVLVVASLVIGVLDSLIQLVGGYVKFHHFDSGKWDKYPFLKDGTKQLTAEAREALKEFIESKKS